MPSTGLSALTAPCVIASSKAVRRSLVLTLAWRLAAPKSAGALFRSLPPTPGRSGSRTFPRMTSILTGRTNAATGTCPALPDGLVVFVKRECETCRVVAPLLTSIDATVYTQDDPSFPAGVAALHDGDLSFSWHHEIETVPTLIRVVNGTLKTGDQIRFMATGSEYRVDEIGIFDPKMDKQDSLSVGEVGYLVASIKQLADVKVGDTVTNHAKPAKEALPGYTDPKPMVFSGLYPIDGSDFPDLRDALDKLKLSDASLVYEPETSLALGFGFRCGFLGLLHMEIVRERLEREAGLNLISTAPNVVYEVQMEDGKHLIVTNPSEYPNGKVAEVQEPIVKATVLAPSEYIGTIMELCQDRRGTLLGMDYLSEDRVEIRYDLPLAEIVFDFFDQLKSRTKGYASLDYEDKGNLPGNLVKVDILLNAETVDAFSAIVHRDKAYAYGVMMTGKLRELIPRQQFEVPIQAAIGAKIIARENIRAIRKDVLAKCYGGDITRKRKLLEKQKEGKKRMKMVGRVEVPQEAFVAALATDADIEKVKAARDK